MSTEIQKAKEQSLDMWYDEKKLKDIRTIICPVPLTDGEFEALVKLGRSCQLNPFLKEIWAIKYSKDSAATIMIGRDGYRKSAQRDPEYDYHQSDAVYSNDKFSVVDGVPQHQYTLTNRGELIGAYCIAKRHKSSRPVYVFAELVEYKMTQGVWVGNKFNPAKPATMIKKVAESQCLRACFQDLLGGTYSPEEMGQSETIIFDEEGNQQPKQTKSQDLMDRLKSAKGKIIDAEVIEESGEEATSDQLEEIHALRAVKVFDAERFKNALEHYKVETLAQMTKVQAEDFIGKLHKLADKE